MPSKITNEDIISYLDKECGESLRIKIDDAIKNDKSVRDRYTDLKDLRMLQAETMLPLLNKQMPENTSKIINSLKEKKTSYVSNFFKLSPIAVIGWLGFATVGTIQVASVITPSSTTSIASLENEKSLKLMSTTNKEDLDDVIIEVEDEFLLVRNKFNGSKISSEDLLSKGPAKISNLFPMIANSKYKFNILNIFEKNEKICLEFEAFEEDRLLDTKEVCFQQK